MSTLSFTSDGAVFVTGGDDGSIKIWDYDSKDCIGHVNLANNTIGKLISFSVPKISSLADFKLNIRSNYKVDHT